MIYLCSWTNLHAKMRNNLLHILLISLILYPLESRADWQRHVTHYSRSVYRAAAQNWMIMQNNSGWMYFANNKGLLEYDGTNWETYPILNAKLRAVKAGHDGRIYVGGLQQFGYFTPNHLGQLDYVCLTHDIDKSTLGNIWNIHIGNGRVWFQSDHAFFYLEKEKIHRIPCPDITTSALIGGRLYVATNKTLKYTGADKHFSDLPDAWQNNNPNHRIISLLPYRNGLLIVQNFEDPYFYRDGKRSELPVSLQPILQGRRITCAALSGDLLAIGTVQDGILLIHLTQGTVEQISTFNGLSDKTILSLYFDHDNNLWLGLDKGIDRVNLQSPVSHHTIDIGSGYSSAIYQGKLYLGTNQGTFTTRFPLSSSPDGNRIEPLQATTGQIYSLAVYDGKLFIAGSGALQVWDGQTLYTITGIRGVWRVKQLEHSQKILAATYFGLYLLQKQNGIWSVDRKVEGSNFSAKTFYLDRRTQSLWMANKESGILRVELTPDGGRVRKQQYYNSKELPKGDNVCITSVDGQIIVAARQGLFRYNARKDQLEPYRELEQLMDGHTAYTYILQDRQRNIWYASKGALKLLRYDALNQKYIQRKSDFWLKDYLIEDFEHVNPLFPDTVLVANEEGFALLHYGAQKHQLTKLNLQIRHLWLTGGKDSLIYGRSYAGLENYIPEIPYSLNSIRIDYCTNHYDRLHPKLYAYRLEGSKQEAWSQFSETTQKEYTNLAPGKYTFSVRAYSENGTPTQASLTFVILPPWYRTWWSYTLYSFLIILLLCYIRYRILEGRKQLVMQKDLESYRQRERFKQESDQKDQSINALKEEKLQTELHYKSEELARTTLNIVRKNEMLQAIRKEVVGITHSISEENLVAIRRKTLRLMGQIDTNLEHDNDLQAFQNSFDSVHRNFFQQLETLCPNLTPKEKQLCAYIKMNLLSKEMAPLLNISLRGVEISRYRLRKKLGLKEGENLAEYLNKLGEKQEQEPV